MSTPLILALRTHAQWLGATGLDLTNLYLCEDADTQLTDAIGTAHLAAVAAPEFQVAGPWPGIVGVGTSPGYFEAASAAVLDHALSDSFMHGAFVAYKDGAAQPLTVGPFGKKLNPTTTAGWQAYTSSSGGGSPGAQVADGGNRAFAGSGNSFANGVPFLWLLINRRGSVNTIRVRDSSGGSSVSSAGVGTVTTTSLFRVGRNYDTAGVIEMVHYRHFHASGAQIETLDDDALVSLLLQSVTSVRAIGAAGGVGLV